MLVATAATEYSVNVIFTDPVTQGLLRQAVTTTVEATFGNCRFVLAIPVARPLLPVTADAEVGMPPLVAVKYTVTPLAGLLCASSTSARMGFVPGVTPIVAPLASCCSEPP